jgi:hypothetical protein
MWSRHWPVSVSLPSKACSTIFSLSLLYAFLKLLTVFDLFITPVFCCVQEHSATCRAEDKQRVRAELEKFRGDTWLNVAGKKFKVTLRTRSLISSAHGWGLRGIGLRLLAYRTYRNGSCVLVVTYRKIPNFDHLLNFLSISYTSFLFSKDGRICLIITNMKNGDI